MPGHEAKNFEVPEASSATRPAADTGEEDAKPLLGGWSLAAPFIGIAVGWLIGSSKQKHDGSGAAWGYDGLFWFIGCVTVFSILGLGLAIAALWRGERLSFSNFLALVLNGIILFAEASLIIPLILK